LFEWSLKRVLGFVDVDRSQELGDVIPAGSQEAAEPLWDGSEEEVTAGTT